MCWVTFNKALFLSGLQETHLQKEELEWLICQASSDQPPGKRMRTEHQLKEEH